MPKNTEKSIEPIVLPQRIHFNEFALGYTQLDSMQKAGLKAVCGNKEWMYLEEWQEQLDKYLIKE